jgi:hypothetical protein
LSDLDSRQLEDVLEDEKKNRTLRSETYYSGSVYLTCIRGGFPVISFTEQGSSITFMFDEDYDKLLELVKEYNSSLYLKEIGSKK